MVNRFNDDAVAQDMADAFRGLPVTRGGGLGSSISVVGAAVPAKRRRGHWLTLAAPTAVAAMLAGLLGYYGLSGGTALVQSTTAATPTPHDVVPKGSPAEHALRHPQAAAATEGALPPRALSPVSPAAGPADRVVTPVPRASPVIVPAPFRQMAAAADRGSDRDDPQPRVARAGEPDDVQGRCAPHSLEDECIYADVLQADRRLQAAYARAARLGVPRGALLSANRRWRDARAMSQDRPDAAIRLYDELASELDDVVANGIQ